MVHVTLSAWADGRWRPGIGDPTLYGWLSVAGYALVAVACYRASGARDGGVGRAFWLTLALCFAFLAINKQLDLQSWLTQVGRELAIRWGWYEQHRLLQRWFIGVVGGTAFAVVVLMGLLIRSRPWAWRLAFGGFVLTLAFVVVRAASFHRVDNVLGQRIAALPINFLLEFGGITIAGLGTLLHLRRIS